MHWEGHHTQKFWVEVMETGNKKMSVFKNWDRKLSGIVVNIWTLWDPEVLCCLISSELFDITIANNKKQKINVDIEKVVNDEIDKADVNIHTEDAIEDQ